jgi:hypothetical protein
MQNIDELRSMYQTVSNFPQDSFFVLNARAISYAAVCVRRRRGSWLVLAAVRRS